MYDPFEALQQKLFGGSLGDVGDQAFQTGNVFPRFLGPGQSSPSPRTSSVFEKLLNTVSAQLQQLQLQAQTHPSQMFSPVVTSSLLESASSTPAKSAANSHRTPTYRVVSSLKQPSKKGASAKTDSQFNPVYKLEEANLKKIAAQRDVFEWVQEKTGVPWQAVAAVWAHENGCETKSSRPGGPFQFDPVRTPKEIKAYFKKYTTLTDAEINQYAPKGVDDFKTGAMMAACWLRDKVKPKITPDAGNELIKEALYGYSGKSSGSADKSAFVMSGFNQNYVGMQLKGTMPTESGYGRESVDRVEENPGLYTLYCQLKDHFG